jgi:hypothetical protein
MSLNYTVQQGDHLSKLAKTFGFSDYTTIWNDPNNSALQQQRQNPNVLYPGDSVYIPDRELGNESAATDLQHNYVKNTNTLKLRLTLVDLYEQPIANAKCTLAVGSTSANVTTDGNGFFEQVIQPTDRSGTLTIQDDQTPASYTQIPLKVGDLDPVDQVSGQTARLNNLGYFAGDVPTPDPKTFESAVEEFQCDQSLTVDGICGPDTQASLKKVHGC